MAPRSAGDPPTTQVTYRLSRRVSDPVGTAVSLFDKRHPIRAENLFWGTLLGSVPTNPQVAQGYISRSLSIDHCLSDNNQHPHDYDDSCFSRSVSRCGGVPGRARTSARGRRQLVDHRPRVERRRRPHRSGTAPRTFSCSNHALCPWTAQEAASDHKGHGRKRGATAVGAGPSAVDAGDRHRWRPGGCDGRGGRYGAALLLRRRNRAGPSRARPRLFDNGGTTRPGRGPEADGLSSTLP
jgi:hypothetical protein